MIIEEPKTTSYFAQAFTDLIGPSDTFFHNLLGSKNCYTFREWLDSYLQGVIPLQNNDTLPEDLTEIDFESMKLYQEFLELKPSVLEEIVNEVTEVFKHRLCDYLAYQYEVASDEIKSISLPFYAHKTIALLRQDFAEWDG